VDFQRVNGAGGGSGLRDLRTDLELAVNSIFQGSPAQRRAYVDRLYTKARLHACA
jgi:plasmid stabilization system protein ParE